MGPVFQTVFDMLNHPMFWTYVFASAIGYIIVKAIPSLLVILIYLLYGVAWVLGRITFYILAVVFFIWEVIKWAWKGVSGK